MADSSLRHSELSPIQRSALANLADGGRQWHLFHGNTWNSLVRRGYVVVNATDHTRPPHVLTGKGTMEVASP